MIMVRYAGIALVSGATLLLELALLRLFAVQQFYHFAFMAVSLALLGAGASGSLLSVWHRRFSSAGSLSPPWLCLLFGLATVGAYLVINTLPFDSFSIAWDSRQILYLTAYFLAIAFPFLFSGLLVGGELMRASRTGSHKVYGANLVGSALGTLASIPALSLAGGEGVVVLAAILGVLSGPLVASPEPSNMGHRSGGLLSNQGRWHMGLTMLALVAGIVLLVRPAAFMDQAISPYKTLPHLLNSKESEHVLTVRDATARVDVVASSAIHVMPGLSLSSPVGPPPQAGLTLDGDNLMPIVGLSPDSDQAAMLVDNVPAGAAFRLRPNARTLLIEAGTGMDPMLALAAGAKQVTAVEDNRLIIELIRNEYESFTHRLYTDGRVKVTNQSGRVFSRQEGNGRYDLLFLSLTDPHRPVSSGAYSLTEEYLYTVEAMGDYLALLDERGLLVVTRWLQTPPSESARLFATMAAALRLSGREPVEHLMAFRSLRTMTVIAGSRPFTETEIEILTAFLRRRGYDAVHFPGIRPEDLNQYNLLSAPVYHDLFARILADPARTFSEYRFDIRPSTDDHPFFFHFFKWRQTPEILASLGLTWQPFGGSGFFVLIALLLLVALASAFFILMPIMLDRASDRPPGSIEKRWRVRVFWYFAALGLAFLFVEMPLAQRFILILGQPVTALAVVLFSLLLFSGLGSLTVSRIRLPWALGILVSLIGIYPFLLEPISALALAWPEWSRIALTIVVLAPLGYLMGVPFASGLRLVERYEPALVPWAWAINGSFSVISAVLAVIIALSWGFSVVLWLGAVAYGMALIAFAGPFRRLGRV